MLSWRLQTGSEKAELQKLNARLYEYVCRVRELERENLLLEEELRRRLSQENLWIEDQTRFAEEARNLRQQLDELNWSTALAEGERDALQRELRELQRESAEASAARSRLDAELSAERRELEEALGALAALEALLGRLEAERCDLDAVHERQVRELRARAASLTMHFRARATGPAVPQPRLQEVHDSYALLVAESWRENVQLYEDEVRELEQALRRGQESRRQAEDEARLCAQEADALRNQALELEQLRARLEDELLRMQEEYGIQAEERQRVIDSLEDEKEALTLAMADRLREYQELVQVKTGLSLEVATYRALLEGESNPEILIWRKDIENMPQASRNASYRYTSSVIQRKNEKNLFPRQKTPWAAVNHSSALHSARPGHLESQTTTAVESRRGFLTSGYSSSATTLQQKSLEKTASGQASLRPAVATPGLLRNTDAQVKTFSDRSKVEGTRDTPIRVTTESIVTRESHKDHRGNMAAGAMNNAQSNDRTVIFGKKLEVKATREQERDRSGVVKLKPEEKMFDSKEKGSEERNLRWEELTKLDRDARARESQQRDEPKEKKSPKERSVKEREVPISLEVSRGSRSEVSTKNLLSSGRKDAGDSRGREAEMKETKFRLDTQDAAGSLQSDSRTETIAENIVTTILKQFTQAPDAEGNDSSLPDTKVTYVDRKELPGSGKTKTEIVLESKLTEDVDVSDEAGLEYLLSKEVKEVGLKGKSAEKMIGEMINIGLKGREGRAKVVNVEIVEEPVSYTGGGTAEFPTPFHVEEVDDVTKQPQGSIPHVEEVTEAGDSEGEQSYFVSTPDEYPGGHDREDDGSVYGQIHIEEESTIRYSWQDEIVQGPWRRKARDDTEKEKHVKVLEVPAPSLGGAVGSAHLKEEASGELHAEPTVTEKEIKIPHEFHTSIKGVFSSEPRHQMVEVIGQLEETLPERVKEELSALTRPGQGEPGSVSVDVKKVQSAASGSVTLMAEVNLSQTVDADQLDLEELSRDEAGEIERAVESVVRESLTKRSSPMPRSPDREDGEEEVSAGGTLFKRWATRQLYSPSGGKEDADWSPHSSDQRVTQGPVSATLEVTSPTGFAQSHVLENISQSVRHVKLGPTEMWGTEQASYGGPTALVVEVSGDFCEAASSEGSSRSVRHVTLGPHQSHVSTEITFQGSLPTWREAGGTGEPGPAEPSEEADISRNHRMSDSEQFHVEKEIHFLGPVSGTAQVGGNFATEELVGTQTFVRHLQLGPKEGFREEIHFVAPISDKVEWRVEEDSGNTQVSLGRSTSIQHIDIGPQRHQTSKLIAPQTLEFRASEGAVLVEGSAGMTQVTHSVTSGREILGNKENTFQTVIPEFPPGSAGDPEAEGTAGTSRSFKHIQIGPSEKGPSERFVILGPLSKTFVLDGSAASPELGGVAGDRSTPSPIAPGPKETSFTFQMDVSNTRAVRSWTRDAGSEVEALSVSEHGGWRIAHSRNEQAATMSSEASAGDEKGTEQAGFDKTVQPQRMVDQRPVASDEKKVALVYLDNEEEEDDGWF
ncbi:Synemin [Microtus ochrogaster]|uniref:Synemin n=1 Tax=Microtus ochrogaster TaxID=79684 RepID=A0A8J6G0V7_MICOH|nr:Synemin [Microtus ochrogaster]